MKSLENLSQRLTVQYNGKPCYDIVFSDNFTLLSKELRKFHIQNKKLCIVTETNVAPLYAEEVYRLLRPECKEIIIHQFPAGEINKNLDTVNDIYQTLITHKFDRNDVLLALGGGVTGDITGFAAASYLRGIDFIQIPTTLLSQVDSSIGGKTGVDYKSYKNMVGAFYMPRLVYMNLSTLKTLGDREYLSGMGEIIKHGLIRDQEYFYWLKEKKENILAREYNTLKEMIYVSCNIKKAVVENDPKEQNERALLNFGHTIGHAVEKLKDFRLLHGEAVAIGMIAASYLSYMKGYLSFADYKDIIHMNELFCLPTSTTDISPEEVVETTLNDKKMDSGIIKFILLRNIGSAVIDRTLDRETICKAIETIVKE